VTKDEQHQKIGEREIHQTNHNAYEIFGESTQISEFFLQESNRTE
jgi:hypothetical protein